MQSKICGETVVNFGGVKKTKVEENIQDKKKIQNKRKQNEKLYMCGIVIYIDRDIDICYVYNE